MKSNQKYIIAIAVLTIATVVLSLYIILDKKDEPDISAARKVERKDIPDRPVVLLTDAQLAAKKAEEKAAEDARRRKEVMEMYSDGLPPEDTSRMAEYDAAHAAPESSLIMYDYEIYDNDDGDYLYFMREQEKQKGVRSVVEKDFSGDIDSAAMANQKGNVYLYDTLGRLIQNPGTCMQYRYRKNILTVTTKAMSDGKILRRSTTVYDGKYPVERTLWWYALGLDKWRGEKEYWTYDSENRMIEYRKHHIKDTTIGIQAWIRYSSDGRHRGIMRVLLPYNPERNCLEYMEETVFDAYDRPVLTFAYNSFDCQKTEIITEYNYSDSVWSEPYEKTVTWYTDGRPHYRTCLQYDRHRNYTGDIEYRMTDGKWIRIGEARYVLEYDGMDNVVRRQVATSNNGYISEYTYYDMTIRKNTPRSQETSSNPL